MMKVIGKGVDLLAAEVMVGALSHACDTRTRDLERNTRFKTHRTPRKKKRKRKIVEKERERVVLTARKKVWSIDPHRVEDQMSSLSYPHLQFRRD